MNKITLHNSLTRSVEDFQPHDPKKVQLFSCGPTVYDYLHIGNGRTAISMDVLVRVLRHAGYDVDAIMNITDIDDKIITRAAEQGIDWKELTHKFEQQYKTDMKSLNVTSFRYERATDHIDDIIRQVQVLLDKGHAYTTSDGIYFEISTFKDYGKLSGRGEVEQDDAQSRVDECEEKRGWNDFALWKFARAGDPTWPAPFGDGRPGWHIEDTAITEHFFGPQYDIHGGGSDLMFPHHEAELTQMEAASGRVPFVKYWLHGGLLYTGGKRMGKSNHNFMTIKDAVAEYGLAVRLMMLQANYRSQMDFTRDHLATAAERFKRWSNTAALRFQLVDCSNEAQASLFKRAADKFVSALYSDLNTPQALAVVEEVFSATAQGLNTAAAEAFTEFLQLVDDTLGLSLLEQADVSPEQKDTLQKRRLAREASDWQTSDDLRDKLAQQGIGVHDAPHGQVWYRI